MVVKLSWNYTIFASLFENKGGDCEARSSEARKGHPEFFLAMHDSLLCGLCNGIALLFKKKENETSVYSLIKRVEGSNPNLGKKLNAQIQPHRSLIIKVRAIRNEFYAHRNMSKTPPQVFSEAQLRLDEMKAAVGLAKLVICELAEEAGKWKRELLETQQLSEETLQCVANDAAQVMRAFVKSCQPAQTD